MSPVIKYSSSVNASFVFSGLFKYPVNTLGPLISIMPGSLISDKLFSPILVILIEVPFRALPTEPAFLSPFKGFDAFMLVSVIP